MHSQYLKTINHDLGILKKYNHIQYEENEKKLKKLMHEIGANASDAIYIHRQNVSYVGIGKKRFKV